MEEMFADVAESFEAFITHKQDRRQLRIAFQGGLDQTLADRLKMKGYEERGVRRYREIMGRAFAAYMEATAEITKKMSPRDTVQTMWKKMVEGFYVKAARTALENDSQAELVYAHLWSRAKARAMSEYWSKMDAAWIATKMTEALQSLESCSPGGRFLFLDYFTELAKLLPGMNSGEQRPAKTFRDLRNLYLSDIFKVPAATPKEIATAHTVAISSISSWAASNS